MGERTLIPYGAPPVSEWNNTTVRALEAETIRRFVYANMEYLHGRVLDFGCGRQPFRELVEDVMGAEYVGYDRPHFAGSLVGEDVGPHAPLRRLGYWDAILTTQTLQFIPRVPETLEAFQLALKPGGHLVMTFETCWDEVEAGDLHRFTRAGMTRLLELGRWDIVVMQRRAEVRLGGFAFPLGYGVVARRRD